MRIPSKGMFVLFQFTGEGAGRVMFQPGPTPKARAHFLECVKDLECLVVARVLRNTEGAILVDTNATPKEECVRYRLINENRTWVNVSDLSDLCRTFGDWIAGDGAGRPACAELKDPAAPYKF